MRRALAVLKLAAIAGVTAGAGLALAIAPGARARVFRTWSRAGLWLVGCRVRVEGLPPRGAFALAANHLSYLDILVLAAHVDVDFVAKADISGWPIIGWLCRRARTLFIDRTRKRDLLRVLPLLERRLREGRAIAFFPEGTTTAGEDVLPFRSPLFEAALRAARPTVCATLRYRTAPGDPDPGTAVCWWGDADLAPHLFALLQLRGLSATVEFVPESLWERDRKRLARSARDAVRKRFAPL